MPNLKTNRREKFIWDKYINMGYSGITKGYPDFCFYNDKEVLFIEVKRKQKRPSVKMGLSRHQREMISIFKRLGLNVRVEYVE